MQIRLQKRDAFAKFMEMHLQKLEIHLHKLEMHLQNPWKCISMEEPQFFYGFPKAINAFPKSKIGSAFFSWVCILFTISNF